jgi:cation transport ATPase
VDAALTITATADGRHRRIDRILEAVERARSEPSTLQAQADRLVARFLPAVMAIAATTLALWWWTDGWRAGVFNAMSVLLVACPCALGLATPLALWVVVARLASRGLTVANGDAVEALAAVDRVVFDKTGTLTEPRTRLVDMATSPPPGMSSEQVEGLVAAVERISTHPVAAAFDELEAAHDGSWVVESLETIPGTGVRAGVRGPAGGHPLEVVIGAADRLNVAASEDWRPLRDQLRGRDGARELAVLVGGRPVAAALVDERLRSSWPEALDTLRTMELPALVMTGDSAERAVRTSGDDVAAGLGPEQKLDRVEALRAAGHRVLMVGDGVNDAAAMAAADVSIAVAGGADLASEVADVVWHGSDLRVIPWALRLSRRSVATIRSNLLLAATYNGAGIGLAVAGLLHPVAAALLMTCSSVVVTFRAMAGLQQEQREAEAASEAAAELRRDVEGRPQEQPA